MMYLDRSSNNVFLRCSNPGCNCRIIAIGEDKREEEKEEDCHLGHA